MMGFLKEWWPLILTAIIADMAWAFVINPWLDRRAMKGGFVEPREYKQLWKFIYIRKY
ncbi:MAG: hypothetical protein HY764_03350 [Candidatus Portnoybacteria bacterium]|nr:hypothetical protein [Candidatus Portnoybacteria bacterium]